MKGKNNYYYIDKLIFVGVAFVFAICLLQAYSGFANECSTYMGRPPGSDPYYVCGNTNKVFAGVFLIFSLFLLLTTVDRYASSQKKKKSYVFLVPNKTKDNPLYKPVSNWILWLSGGGFLLFLIVMFLLITRTI